MHGMKRDFAAIPQRAHAAMSGILHMPLVGYVALSPVLCLEPSTLLRSANLRAHHRRRKGLLPVPTRRKRRCQSFFGEKTGVYAMQRSNAERKLALAEGKAVCCCSSTKTVEAAPTPDISRRAAGKSWTAENASPSATGLAQRSRKLQYH